MAQTGQWRGALWAGNPFDFCLFRRPGVYKARWLRTGHSSTLCRVYLSRVCLLAHAHLHVQCPYLCFSSLALCARRDIHLCNARWCWPHQRALASDISLSIACRSAGLRYVWTTVRTRTCKWRYHYDVVVVCMIVRVSFTVCYRVHW